MKLEGHTAVVTGGARGIGLAITKTLLQNKVKVKARKTSYFYSLSFSWATTTHLKFITL